MSYKIDMAEFDDVEEMCATQMAAIEEFGTDDYTDAEINAWTGYINLPHALNTLQDDTTEVFAARDENEMLIGFCTVKGNQITDMYVDPDHGGEGIGSALLRKAEWHIRKMGSRNIRLLSTLNSVGFYECKGFEVVTKQQMSVNEDISLEFVEMRKRFSGTV